MSSSDRAPTDKIEDLPDEYLRCRVYGHNWDPIPSTLADPAYQRLFDWYDVLRCISCGTERYDGVNGLGRIDQRSYNYPHGYPLSFSLPRAEARVEYLLRTRASERIRTSIGSRRKSAAHKHRP